jgi:hypothetical protein
MYKYISDVVSMIGVNQGNMTVQPALSYDAKYACKFPYPCELYYKTNDKE